jgi:hypothetical protein
MVNPAERSGKTDVGESALDSLGEDRRSSLKESAEICDRWINASSNQGTADSDGPRLPISATVHIVDDPPEERVNRAEYDKQGKEMRQDFHSTPSETPPLR